MRPAAALSSVGAAILGLLVWGCGPHPPSDAELQERFDSHRAEYERLVQMMDEDWQMARVAPDFTWKQDNLAWPRPESQWGISRQRWDEYRKIFDQAGVKDGVTRSERSSDIILDVWSWGIVPAGTSVGYLHCGAPRNGYSHTEPACIENRESGKGFYGTSTSYGYRYKKIAPDWYILEESN